MKDGNIQVLIASKIFDQGIDIPELDALILAGSGKSSGRALQRIGRVIRKSPGKKKAIVVEFFDNCKYLRDHSEARIKVYKSEPGFNIKMPKNKVLHAVALLSCIISSKKTKNNSNFKPHHFVFCSFYPFLTTVYLLVFYSDQIKEE